MWTLKTNGSKLYSGNTCRTEYSLTVCIRICQLVQLFFNFLIPRNRPEGPGGGGGRRFAVFFFDLGGRRGGWSAPCPGRFTPGNDPVPIVQEAGWAPGPVWACAKNLAPPGFDLRTVQPIASRYTGLSRPIPVQL
jgi:hypothetical protein